MTEDDTVDEVTKRCRDCDGILGVNYPAGGMVCRDCGRVWEE